MTKPIHFLDIAPGIYGVTMLAMLTDVNCKAKGHLRYTLVRKQVTCKHCLKTLTKKKADVPKPTVRISQKRGRSASS